MHNSSYTGSIKYQLSPAIHSYVCTAISLRLNILHASSFQHWITDSFITLETNFHVYDIIRMHLTYLASSTVRLFKEVVCVKFSVNEICILYVVLIIFAYHTQSFDVMKN